jgi:hypothetical protein
MPTVHPGAALLLTLGCSGTDLAHTPIVGGTEPVRQAIRDELATFAEATGRERLPVSRVRVADLGQTIGRYNHVTRSIALDEELDEGRVIEVLRHELCHALDASEQLHQQQPALYDRLARGVFSSPFAEDIDGCEGEGCQRREVFAAYCAHGPWVAHAMAQRCEGDPPDAQRVLRSMAAQIWTESEAPQPTSEGSAWASVELDSPEVQVRARATTDPDTLGLVFEEPGVSYIEFLDAFSGERATDPDLELLPSPRGPPPGLPFELPEFEIAVGDELAPVGFSEGPYLGTVRVPLFELGDVLRRAWHDGERWWLVGDGCASQTAPFLVGEHVLTLRISEERVSWGPIEL